MPQAVTVTPEEREAIERVSLSVLVFYLLFKKKICCFGINVRNFVTDFALLLLLVMIKSL